MKVKLSELFFLLRTAASKQKRWLYVKFREGAEKEIESPTEGPSSLCPIPSFHVVRVLNLSICRSAEILLIFHFMLCWVHTHELSSSSSGLQSTAEGKKHKKERKEVKHTIFSSKFAALCYGRDRAERRKIQHEKKNWNENCAEKRFVHPGSLCCCLTLFFLHFTVPLFAEV